MSVSKLIIDEGMPVRELSEELNVKDTTLRRWSKEYEELTNRAFPGNGSPKLATITQFRQACHLGEARIASQSRFDGYYAIITNDLEYKTLEVCDLHGGGFGRSRRAFG